LIAKFLTIKFEILAAVTLVMWVGTYFIVRAYWKKIANAKTIKSDFKKVPINNTLTVMVIGLVSYRKCPEFFAHLVWAERRPALA